MNKSQLIRKRAKKLAKLTTEQVEELGDLGAFWGGEGISNANRSKLWRVRHKRDIKIEVLFYYGGDKLACILCGETRLPCLTIDHIDNKTKDGKLYGIRLYKKLKADNFPRGFQTLCMNCQWVKREENKEYNHLKQE